MIETVMIKQIIRDTFFLSQRSKEASKEDLTVGQDLRDTLKANRERCAGMAANMIGIQKRVIIVSMGPLDVVMYNPVITKKSGEYEPFEGCLSLDGGRKAKRYKDIEVEYLDDRWKKHRDKYSGWTAQVIQHECDHLDGILI